MNIRLRVCCAGFGNDRESIPLYAEAENHEPVKKRFFDLLVKIERAAAAPRTDAIDRFSRDETLEELVAAIERDISANKPAAALDRLHTYCMKKFGHLLDSHGVPWERKDPLHSRAGKYVKALEASYPLRDASRQIIKNAIGVFEKFNYVRNDDSLAHDNDLPIMRRPDSFSTPSPRSFASSRASKQPGFGS